jgi:diketogulonate reductase-like aldo/keto reductase
MAEDKHYIVLNTGAHMPLLGLGTFLAKPGEVKQAVKTALRLGYRHLDCAEGYDNQKEIGEALQEAYAELKLSRKDIFITSKLSVFFMEPSLMDGQLEKTLKDLQTDYLDLYLIHQPGSAMRENNVAKARRGVSIQTIWRKFETFYDAGKTKAIGVSNFNTAIFNDLINYCRIKPAMNQIERHPYLIHKRHIDYCRSEGVEITAYGSLGAPGLMAGVDQPLLSNPVILEVAKKHNKTAAQVLIRWSIEGKVVSIPKSIKPERIEENFKVWDFKLSEEEMKAIDNLDRSRRYFQQDWFGVPLFS